MADTSIEWATKSWNVLRGCSRVSDGCRNCYAERQANRFAGPGQPYEGLVRISEKSDGRREPRWTGKVRFVPEKLHEPMRWRKPERIFVNSMSDLFHEEVSNEQIAAIFGVMAACPQHTFLVLTKRPERMLEWFRWYETAFNAVGGRAYDSSPATYFANVERGGILDPEFAAAWPLLNVDIGVSVEDQLTADKRIPLLLLAHEHIGGALWASYEPALGPLVFQDRPGERHPLHAGSPLDGTRAYLRPSRHAPRADRVSLDQIVIGGESGPRARPFHPAWARSVIAQCREARVAVFMKQLGDRCLMTGEDWSRWPRGIHSARYSEAFDEWFYRPLRKKGGDMVDWSEDLRVREYPKVRS